MSINTPNGILDITNAIVRVSKMEFQQATGFDTVLNNIARNTILLSDSATYETHSTYHNWALKLPNAWVFEADVYFQSGTPGVVAKLNFYNNVNTAITNGYTLELDGTSLVLKYDGTQISTATLSTTLNDDAWHKLFVLFERDTIAVAIDGKAEYTFTDSELRARVYNDDTGYVVFYHESGTYARKIKNLKFVNGDKWLRESGSSNIAYVGGSVGVGTDAPRHTLDVFGNANVGTLTSTGIYGEIVGSNAVGASTGTFSGDLQVGTANLFVDVSTSNVGIGTDTPLATLDVQGDFLAGVTGNLFVNSDTGSVGISNTAPVHTLDVGSNLYVQNGGDTVLYVQGNAVVSNKLTVESFRISSSSSSGLQAVTSGVGANSTTNRIEITNADNSTSTSTGALALTNGGLGVAGDIVAGGSLTLSSDLAVDTNTLKVDAGNNRVGILTASPQYGLDVHGTANVGALTATSSTVSGALSAASASITGQLLVDTDTLTVDAVNDRVGVNTASPQYDLDVSGNVAVSSNLMVNTNTLFVDSVNSRVGVGTGSPSKNLQVYGTSYPSIVVGGPNSDIRLVTDTVSPYDQVIRGTSNVVIEAPANSKRLFINGTNGNVGIGTNSPGSKLHVYDGTAASLIVEGGNNTIGTDTAQIILRNKVTRRAGLEFQDDSDNSRIWHIGRRYVSGGASTKLSFSNVNDDEVMTITNAGNVGIGIANPSAKLHVNGNFYAPGSVVQVQSLQTKDSYTTTNASGSGATDDTGIKHSITPKFSTSKILVNFNFLAYLNNQTSSTPNGARIQVKRKINGLSQTTVYGTITGHDLHCYLGNPVSLHSYINVSFIDSPNTTGVVEYELGARLYNASGGLDIGNASNQPITIILSEIAV